MGLNIRILSGKRAGDEFKLRAGISIGRKAADLKIRDAKMSSLHALITERDGDFYLVDQDSRNKILVAGQEVEELVLKDGVRFILGDTEFEIFELPTSDIWEEELIRQVRKLEKDLRNQPAEIYPFSSSVILRVQSGPDRGRLYPIGYGPRSAGKDSLDLNFQEHFERRELFILREEKNKLIFATEYPDLFLINKEPVKTETILDDGDIIKFGKTEVQVNIGT